MEMLVSQIPPVCPALLDKIVTPALSILDIGCAGGIDPVFLSMAEYCKAVGVDGNINEIHRLQAENTSPNIIYLDALLEYGGDACLNSSAYNLWQRLSVAISVEIRKKLLANASITEKVVHNLWDDMPQSLSYVSINHLIQKYFPTHLDILKIDIDGPDFAVLRSLDQTYLCEHISAVCMEVNFTGEGHNEKEHSFCNTDKYLRQHGFSLFGLTVRPYSRAALPLRYQWSAPCQSVQGQPVQGDALYIKDICAKNMDSAFDYSAILRFVLLYSLFNLPDCAAEVILKFRDVLDPHIDCSILLDKLTKQACSLGKFHNFDETYHTYMRLFHEDNDQFYNAVPSAQDEINRILNTMNTVQNGLMSSQWRKLRQKLKLIRKYWRGNRA